MDLEVPRASDVRELPVQWTTLDEPWVTSVTAWANDGDIVTVTWDEVAASVHVRWAEGDRDRLVVEREAVTKVGIRGGASGVEFRVGFGLDEYGGEISVRVDNHVVIVDALLRR